MFPKESPGNSALNHNFYQFAVAETRPMRLSNRPVPKPDSRDQHGPSDMTTSANNMPAAGASSVLPPSLSLTLKPGRLVATWFIAAAMFVAGTGVPAGAAEPKEVRGEPGVSYMNDKVSREPWSIHVLKIDRSRKDLAFYAAHAKDKVLGVAMIAEQARAVPR